MSTLLLTGGSGEIGGAISKKFQSRGWQVISPTRAEMDLSDIGSISAYMNQLKIPIDVFVHCAGFNEPKAAGVLTHEDVQTTMQINALSFYDIILHLLGNFKQKKKGVILAISSIYGGYSRKGRLAYVASKHALNGMVKTLALELGEFNIRVNGVAPGFVNTRMTYKNNSPETIEMLKKRIPMGNLIYREEVDNLSCFMCGDESNFINGEIITIDSGYTVGLGQE